MSAGTSRRRILITGASRGIGACIADSAARRGWTNLLVSRDEPAMRRMIDGWRGAKDACDHRCLAQDLTAPDALRRLIAWLEEVGYPDTFVHNAAVGHFGRFAQTPLQGHEDTIGLGVRMTVELTHALLPRLSRAASGFVVYVGSTSGRKPVPYMSVYSSTKAFIHNFAAALREELAGAPPKVLLVVPGGVRTDFPRLAGLPADFTARGLSPAAVGDTIVQAIADGREGTLTLGSLKERYGGPLHRLLPAAFWARKMRKAYEPMLPRPPR